MLNAAISFLPVLEYATTQNPAFRYSCLTLTKTAFSRSLHSISPSRVLPLGATSSPTKLASQWTHLHYTAKMKSHSSGTPYAGMGGRLAPELLMAIEKSGYTNMSPVQEKVLSMPDFRADCLVQAKTGTGKTIAFLLPVLQTILSGKRPKRGQVGALIVAPTRELASQIAVECDKLTAFCKPPIECHLAFGGSHKKSHLKKFEEGDPTILVATPGRLNDYLSDPSVAAKFSDLHTFILDEADTMLDHGFLKTIKKTLASLPPKESAGWQGMCFSATLPESVKKVAHHVLEPNFTHITTFGANEAPTIDSVQQSVVAADSIESLLPTLYSVLRREVEKNPKTRTLVFAPAVNIARLLHATFSMPNRSLGPLPVFQMHSRMTQSARTNTVQQFRSADCGILFATDVVGRGIDFPDVALVVQVGIPMNPEQYVHRVGRTGRAGKTGRATMILIPEEMPFIEKNKSFLIKPETIQPSVAVSAWSSTLTQDLALRLEHNVKYGAVFAYLGYFKQYAKLLRIKTTQVVNLFNRLATAVGYEEPPALPKNTLAKMGLADVPGLRVR